MANKGKDYKSEEENWNEYFSSIGKPERRQQPKKGVSISETLKHILESIGIGREKKTGFEEVKEQVAIFAEEGRKKAEGQQEQLAGRPAGEKERPAAESRIGRWAAGKKGPAREEEFAEKKGLSSSMEKYLEKVEENESAEKKGRALEGIGKTLEEKAVAKQISPGFFASAKRVLLLPMRKEKPFVEKKILLLPKAKKAIGVKKAVGEKAQKGRAAALAGKKGMAVFSVPASPLAEGDFPRLFSTKKRLVGKTVEEIKKLSPKEIRKELDKEKIEARARGWYGDALKHKRAAVSGWRLRKKAKLHQLKKKGKRKKLSKKEKKTIKGLMVDDRELRGKIGQLDQQIRALQRIASEKKRENRELEEKVRAIGVALPKKETVPVEGRESQLKKGEMVELVETMKKVADEMAVNAARQSIAGLESEEAMPIEDRIKAQENMIKNLERSFYKRKVDFDQFREKMFDYQSKLTEMKIRKKIREERMESLSPEMKRAMERRIAAGELGKGIGIAPKTAEALEAIAEGKTREKEIGAEAVEAIKRISEKQAMQAGKEIEEKRFAEKTASALQRISERLGGVSREGSSADAARIREAAAQQQRQQPTQAAVPASQGGGAQMAQPALQAYQGGTGQQASAYGKETQGAQAQPGLGKEYSGQVGAAAQGAQAQPGGGGRGKDYSGQQGTAMAGAQTQAPKYEGLADLWQGRQPPSAAGQQYKQQVYIKPHYQGPVYQQGFNVPKGKAAKGKEKAGKKALRQAGSGPQYQGPAYTGQQYQQQGSVYRGTEQQLPGWMGEMPRPAADFYEDERPQKQKKGFFRRLKGVVSEKPASRRLVGEEVDRVIREKAVHAGVGNEQIDRIEKKLGELLERYRIPEAVVANSIRAFDEGRLIQDFQKLMSLIEEKKENSVAELIRPAPGFDISSGIISGKKEKIEGREREIRRARIETSFDKVLGLVQVKGAISLNEVAAKLGMSKEEVQQCAEILERSRLINLNYPPIGPVKLIYPAYLKWKAEEKKKEAEEKKQKKEKK